MKQYKHLNEDERLQICILKREGLSNTVIAMRLDRHRATITRELKRNSIRAGKYDPLYAERKRQRSLSYRRKGFSKIVQDERLVATINEKLKEFRWSPDTIAGRMKKEGKSTVCTQTIYRYMYNEKPELVRYLKYKKGYRKRGVKETRGSVSQGRSIDERPKSVQNRNRFGHREIDTIWGKRFTGGGLLTIVERKSRYCEITKLKTRKSEEVKEKTIGSLEKHKKKKLLSITRDNGKEFALYKPIEEELGIYYYAAHTYASHERGTNEHTNGMIRVFYPKKTDFSKIGEHEIQEVQDKINNKPRKILKYKTAYEVFFSKNISYF